MGQIGQIVGSVLVLIAFAAAQRGILDQKSRCYLLLNIAGSAVLAIDAAVERQWGFVLLEGVWGVVTAVALLGVLQGPARAFSVGSADHNSTAAACRAPAVPAARAVHPVDRALGGKG